jgi:hypothetical protein
MSKKGMTPEKLLEFMDRFRQVLRYELAWLSAGAVLEEEAEALVKHFEKVGDGRAAERWRKVARAAAYVALEAEKLVFPVKWKLPGVKE